MKITSLVLAAGAMLFAIGGAEAMPAAPLAQDSPVILARAGCGFGAHRGPYGGCRLNRGPRGSIRAMMTGAPRGCPPRMYRGRYGRCHYR
ncbi:GCG_CRPN prefix-to-repeats domain-containing protein [Lichenifustis flavocetrariae]|uniref:Uncharacterized protein n=1 Tax=Lichenifustis flavocetrariae TaxID=2949735 RepID=A0AA41YUZ9_9HYPH|nr:hypothetical protein [Lichenifustis flavocetrariae]MCW6507393.1 hypothetical protein [Lichenifustis flavocetrariae]